MAQTLSLVGAVAGALAGTGVAVGCCWSTQTTQGLSSRCSSCSCVRDQARQTEEKADHCRHRRARGRPATLLRPFGPGSAGDDVEAASWRVSGSDHEVGASEQARAGRVELWLSSEAYDPSQQTAPTSRVAGHHVRCPSPSSEEVCEHEDPEHREHHRRLRSDPQ